MSEKGEPVILTGPDNGMFTELIERRDDRGRFRFDAGSRRGNGLSLLSLGRELYERRGADTMDTGPLYMRKSEAELSLESQKNQD